MKGVEIPTKKKDHKNAERILPFPQQLIEKFREGEKNPHARQSIELP